MTFQRGLAVSIHVTKPLVAWDLPEVSPSLQTVRQFPEAILDDGLLAGLQTVRANDRNKSPVRVLWGTVLVTIAVRHPSVKSCLAELRRNDGLRCLPGIDPEEKVPKN